MKHKRFTEEQIIAMLKHHEAGVSVSELARQHGVSQQSIYRWKGKYHGMEIAQVKQLRATLAGNTKLKRLLAESMLEKAALEDVLSKKW